jgi:hypothetical protein
MVIASGMMLHDETAQQVCEKGRDTLRKILRDYLVILR